MRAGAPPSRQPPPHGGSPPGSPPTPAGHVSAWQAQPSVKENYTCWPILATTSHSCRLGVRGDLAQSSLRACK